MFMLPVDATIQRIKRDLTVGMLLKLVLVIALLGCMVVGYDEVRLLGLLGIGSLWVWLTLSSARSSRAAAESPLLIASGQFEEAERNIEQTVRSFSMFRTVKLQALHHLAVLRHAQRRWQDSAALSRALLRLRLGTLQPISKSTRLMLADSLLEMNDLHGTHEALVALQQEPLNLAESMNLLSVQLDYSARVDGWEWMMQNVMAKVQLLELLPAGISARAQAQLALAAGKIGRMDFRAWLRSRAQLLTDVEKMVNDRPMLKELWP